MGKLEPFDRKRTKWQGLWYHSETYSYTSASLSLADIRKFKGNIRLVVKKNKFYQKGENRPNYIFMLVDSNSDEYSPWVAEDDVVEDDGKYYDGDGNRLFTKEEVQYAIDRAADDGARGYVSGNNIVEDYLDCR